MAIDQLRPVAVSRARAGWRLPFHSLSRFVGYGVSAWGEAGYLEGTRSWCAHVSNLRYLEVPSCATLYSPGFLFLCNLFLFFL